MSRRILGLYYAVMVALAVAGIVFLAVAAAAYLTPFAAVRASLDQLASGGVAESYTADVQRRLATASLLLTVALAAAAGWMAYHRPWLPARVSAAIQAERASLVQAWRAMRGNWPAIVALAVVTAVGLALRVAFLFRPLHYDETVTYFEAASKPLWVAVSNYYAPNNHVLHSCLMWASCRMFGDAEWALRLPALAAGVLMIPAAYAACKTLFDRAACFVTAALVATSSTLIEYSTNGRGYTLVCLWFLISLWLARGVFETNRAMRWAALALVWACGLWTIPTMAYGAAVVAAWLAALELAAARRRPLRAAFFGRLVLTVIAAVMMAAALYLPVMILQGPSVLLANEFVAPQTLAFAAARLPASLAATWSEWNRDLPWPVAALLAIGFIASLALPRRSPEGSALLAPLAIAVCVAVVLMQRVDPFPRVWLFLLPVYFMTSAAGLCELLRRWSPLAWQRCAVALLSASIAVACGASVLARQSITKTILEPHADELAALLRDELQPDDLIICAPPTSAPLEYYFLKQGLPLSHFAYRHDAVERPERLLVVATLWNNQTCERLVAGFGWNDRAQWSTKKLLADYSVAQLYAVDLALPADK